MPTTVVGALFSRADFVDGLSCPSSDGTPQFRVVAEADFPGDIVRAHSGGLRLEGEWGGPNQGNRNGDAIHHRNLRDISRLPGPRDKL